MAGKGPEAFKLVDPHDPDNPFEIMGAPTLPQELTEDTIDAVPQTTAKENSQPITVPEARVPKSLRSKSIEEQIAEAKEAIRVPTIKPEMALEGTIANLKKKYPRVAEKFPTLFEDGNPNNKLNWDLRYRIQGAGNTIVENPQDVEDYAALMAIDAQVESHEQELESLVLKILERKEGKRSLSQKFKELLPDWLG